MDPEDGSIGTQGADVKRCSKCGQTKPREEFHVMRRSADGLHAWCKECNRAHRRAYHEANRERDRATKRAYGNKNRERIAERGRAYREAKRESILKQKRAYHEANKERESARKRAWYEANRETIIKRKKKHREANREREAEYQRVYQRARNQRRTLALQLLKETCGCIDCGTRDGVRLYHVEPTKPFNARDAARSRAVLFEEVLKCEVLCRGCVGAERSIARGEEAA